METNVKEQNADSQDYSKLFNNCTSLTKIPTCIFSEALTTIVPITKGCRYCAFLHELNVLEDSKFKS